MTVHFVFIPVASKSFPPSRGQLAHFEMASHKGIAEVQNFRPGFRLQQTWAEAEKFWRRELSGFHFREPFPPSFWVSSRARHQ
jgi:hypothetical protein